MKKTIIVTEKELDAIYKALREAESKRLGEDYPSPPEEEMLVGIQAAIQAVLKAEDLTTDRTNEERIKCMDSQQLARLLFRVNHNSRKALNEKEMLDYLLRVEGA